MDIIFPAEAKRIDDQHSVSSGDHNDTEKKNGQLGATGQVDFEHEPLDTKPGCLGKMFEKLSDVIGGFLTRNGNAFRIILILIFNGLIIAFFFGCLYYYLNYTTEDLELCSGFGSLIAFLSIVYFFVIYFMVVKRFFGKRFEDKVWNRIKSRSAFFWRFFWVRVGFCLAVAVGFLSFILWDTNGDRGRLISLSGLCILLLLGFTFSKHPGRIDWRPVCAGLALQLLFGVLFIRWDAGRAALQCFSDKVSTFLSYGMEGASFVFGKDLVEVQQVFAFSSLPVIFFFSMLVEVLFFWGALQWFCLKLGQVLQAATGTTVCESVICVSNVFLGMAVSALIIKPYLSMLTPSEIHVVMGSGFATVSGTILAAYINFGARPEHLITASVMSAPAALCYCKLLLPETKRSLTSVDNIQTVESQDQSTLSAATRGATNGIALVLNVIANIVAFVSFIAFLNGVLGYGGGLLGFHDLSLEWIFGKVFIPLCYVMGVPWEECEHVGTLIGIKTMVNEFVAYQKMGEMKAAGLLSPRSELIATYSLCGFTNPGSAGIMIGAIAAMAPNQRETLSSVAARAFFAGCGICFMTASIAGLLMPDGSFE